MTGRYTHTYTHRVQAIMEQVGLKVKLHQHKQFDCKPCRVKLNAKKQKNI